MSGLDKYQALDALALSGVVRHISEWLVAVELGDLTRAEFYEHVADEFIRLNRIFPAADRG